MQKNRMGRVRVLAAALSLALVAACSPEYNWREVSVGGEAGMVLFPDKPRSQQRSLEYAGHEVQFTLTTADIGGTIFAVGHAPWPAPMLADEAMQQGMGKEVVASLYRNLGREAPAELPGFGQLFEVNGDASSGMRLRAQVWVSGHGLVEGIVMGPADGFPDAAAGEFLESIAKGR